MKKMESVKIALQVALNPVLSNLNALIVAADILTLKSLTVFHNVNCHGLQMDKNSAEQANLSSQCTSMTIRLKPSN